jgi:hypothetical protein
MFFRLNSAKILAIFFLFIINYKLSAQRQDTLKRPFEVGIEAQAGFVYKHTKKLDPVKTGTPYGFQLYLARKTTGTKYWHQLYNYPTFGVSLTYMSLGNKDVLGDAVIGLAYFQLDLHKRPLSSLTWSLGTGLAYCNTVYDKKENPTNLAISNPINYSIQMQFAYHQQITEKLKIKGGLGLTHISNGSIRKPNLGINVPIVNLALFYNPVPGKIVYKKCVLDPCKKDWKFLSAYYVSFSRRDSSSNKVYPAHIISLSAVKRFNYRHSLLIGMDGIYDTSLQPEIEQQKNWGLHPKEEIWRALVTIGHELSISSKFSFTTQMGIYVYKPFKSKSWAYQRLNMKYYVTKNFFIGSSLRTHFGTADGVEIGGGFKI